MLGVDIEFDGFDIDIITAINSAFMNLNQLNIGPEAGYSITNSEQNWVDFLTTFTNLEGVKTYIYLKTRLIFDPPTNSFLVESFNNQIKELEWRLCVQADPDPIV